MIASKIGRTLLTAYNQANNTNYSAQEFFEKEFFRLFYDHDKYMQWVTNSPFVQGIRKGVYPTSAERLEKLEKLKSKIKNDVPDASIAIGFPSMDVLATTSGQLSNLSLAFKEEDVYSSWIGGGLGIGVQGGLSIYFDNPHILMTLLEGWHIYRNEYLNKITKLRPNQIDTWNGQWIAYRWRADYNPHSFIDFNQEALNTNDKSADMEISTQSWLKVLFGIARTFPDTTLTGYVFNLGQTNRTIGFIPFHLPQITRPIELYKKLFGEHEFLKNARQIEELFGSEYSFVKACEMGVIGLKALEPKGLKGFVYPDNQGEIKVPNYKKANDIQILTFKTYITWIIAMLNGNQTLWEKAEKYARTLIDYEESDKKGKTKKSNEVEEILKSPYRKQFIDGLTTLLSSTAIDPEIIHQLAEEADQMPRDNFPYFLTLIRFKHAFLKNTKSQN